MLCEYIVKAHL